MRRDGAHHRRRSADVELHATRPAAAPRAHRSSGAGDEALGAAAAVFGRRHGADAEALERLDVVELARAARAVEERRRCAAARRALRRASGTARGRRRPRPSTPACGGSTGSNGRPSGPRHATRAAGFGVVEQPRADADALVEEREPGRMPVRVAEDFEDRERPPQQRIGASRGLDHHELAGPREPGDLRRVECEHAVVVGQPRVRQDRRIDVARHTRSIHFE